MTGTVATLAGAQAQVSEEAIAALAELLRGQLIADPPPDYAGDRRPFNAMHADRPSLVVQATGTADVVDAVRFAREHGLEVTVRGGGHSIAGLSSSDGGMVIDLSQLNGVDVDPEARLARVQGGALWGDVDREAQAFGLATPGGLVSDTGVAGLTLGGGYGWLRRKHGLSADNVVSAQVVTADGEVLTASADSNPDLYWAIRGGGGNFGIVTQFTFQLHPVGPMVAFAGVFYPVEQAATVLRGFRDFAERAPEEVTAEAVTITLPADPHVPEPVHDRAVVVIAATYAGDADQGMKVLQPLRELGEPLADITQPMPFRIVQTAFDALFPRDHFQSYWKALYLAELTDEVIDRIAAKALDRPAPLIFFVVWQMGGAVNRVGAEDTAFGERSAKYMVTIDGNWVDPADTAANIQWVRDQFAELSEFGTGGTYLNFTGISDETPDVGVDDAFGRNLRRLAEIKATYDPDNFFRRNNNIAPA